MIETKRKRIYGELCLLAMKKKNILKKYIENEYGIMICSFFTATAVPSAITRRILFKINEGCAMSINGKALPLYYVLLLI